MVDQDYEDLFSTLNAHKIKFLVIGAHAVVFYTEPRYTKDLDVWIPAALNDPQRVYKAFKAFGAPLRHITPDDFRNPKLMLQIGVDPVRVDILVDVPGISSAQEAWKHRKRSRYGKAAINILGLDDLIKTKRAAGRPHDKLDLAKLTAKKRK